MLLFSAHILYGKGKYLEQTVFFYKICQAPNLYNFKGVTHRIQLT